ncbi:hypothetical protein ACFQMJ_04615 [Cohnella cellulosilytica]|uniref:Uncharacterized protein n=2 Tax=Cohnella cellulosilytica TaxID=986710 RepID=A0ABW2F3N0_9BACL
MKIIQYPEDRRKVIVGYSLEELKEFFYQMPSAIRLSAIKRLPKQNGFREGKDTDYRLNLFFRRMNRWNEAEWGIFSKIWLSWTASNDQFRKLLSFRTGEELEDVIEKMMKDPEESSRVLRSIVSGEITQELIRSWLKFSPFYIDMETLWLVTLAPTQHYRKLQNRLDALEEQMGTNFKNQEDLYKMFFETTQGNLSMLNSSIAEIRREIEEVTEVQNEIAQISNEFKFIGNKTATLNDEMDVLSNLIPSLVSNNEHFKKQLESLVERTNEHERYFNDLSSNYSRLEISLNEINSNEDITNKAWGMRDIQHAAATEKVDSFIERNIVFQGEPTKLSSIESIASHLKNNFNRLGIKLADAKSVSFEVLCAVLSNQFVMFSGSMSMIVAEYCAASLSSHAIKIIKVPIGKTGELVSEERIESWLNETRASGLPLVVIFDGINRSAFEIYGSHLKKYISERIVGLRKEYVPIIFLATLLEGASVLGLSKELLDIGPVFNTDYLGWSYKSTTPSIPGEIDPCLLTRSEIEINDYLELEDLLPNGIIEHGSVLWRKTLAVTYKTMIEINPSFDFTSVNFGWLIPMTMLQLPDHVEQLFDEVELDERSKALIKNMTAEV